MLTLKLSLHGLVLAESGRQKPPKFTCNESHDFRFHDACFISFCLRHLTPAFQFRVSMKRSFLKIFLNINIYLLFGNKNRKSKRVESIFSCRLFSTRKAFLVKAFSVAFISNWINFQCHIEQRIKEKIAISVIWTSGAKIKSVCAVREKLRVVKDIRQTSIRYFDKLLGYNKVMQLIGHKSLLLVKFALWANKYFSAALNPVPPIRQWSFWLLHNQILQTRSDGLSSER